MARSQTHVSIPQLKRNLIIAGGGLAGLSLAIALRRRGVEVTVLEAGSYPRHRVCGEFISGVTAETLAALGISDLFEDARLHRSLAWHDRGREIHRATLPEPALGISRHVLDERLRERFESLGGELKTGVRARPEPCEGFVWAAGRRARTGRWLGLKAHVKIPRDHDLEMHAGSNGYAGLAGVEDGWVNVCGLFRIDRAIASRGTELLPAYLEAGGNHALADTLRDARWREDSFSAVAGFELGHQPPIPGLLCLGDAECMIPPFTGNGMAMAFQAAERAMEPLFFWSAGGAWTAAANEIRVALHRKFRRRMAAARLSHQILLDPAGRSVLQSLSDAGLLPFRPMLALLR